MSQVILAICGGFHAPRDSEGVLNLWRQTPTLSAMPAVVLGHDAPWAPLSAYALRQSLDQALLRQGISLTARLDLILWAFSAGGVGAVALAHHWQRYRGTVRALFLLDGWGVPWAGQAPLHRLSHDAFTDASSRWLGAGLADFVAEPAVPHLELWRSPQTVMGRGSRPPLAPQTADPSLLQSESPIPSAHSGWRVGEPLSAGAFLTEWSQFYGRPATDNG